MKINFSKEAKAGLFGLIALFGIYWGINFLKGIEIFSSYNTINVVYDKSDNLEVSAPVLLRGINIGTVISTTLSEDNRSIIVAMNIDSHYPIPDDSKIVISNKSMLSGKAIMVEMGLSTTMLKDGDTVKGEIDNNMQEEINDVKGKLLTTVEELTKTLEGINKILNDTTIQNINSSIDNVRLLTESAEGTMRRNSLQIDTIMSNLSDLTTSLNEDAPAIMGNIRTITDSISGADIAATLRSSQQTIASINRSIEAINNQEGTIGKMLYDPSMYNNLNGAADSLKLLFGDIKRQPGRYVHFSLFGKKDK